MSPQWSRRDPREALADYGACFEIVILDGTHAERAVVYCGQESPGVHGWGVYGETREWGPHDAWDGWRWIRISDVPATPAKCQSIFRWVGNETTAGYPCGLPHGHSGKHECSSVLGAPIRW